MNHPDDGVLQSFVDGELTAEAAAELRGHLERCPACAQRADDMGVERRIVSEALSEPDIDVFRIRAAREAVLDQAGEAATSPGAAPWWRGSLTRAAGLVLLLAGAGSAAIPGSPVRVWLEQRIDPPAEPAVAPVAEPVEAAPATPPTESGPQEAGIQVEPGDGPFTVSITGLPAGAAVEVVLVDGRQSGVYAPEGSRFATTPGGLQAHVDGGYVRVELSRSLDDADVEVDGAIYLRKVGDRLELPGPGQDSTEAHFRFQVPNAPGESG